MVSQIKILTRHGQPVFLSGCLCGWMSPQASGRADGLTVTYVVDVRGRKGASRHAPHVSLVLERCRTFFDGREVYYLSVNEDDVETLHRYPGFIPYDEAAHGPPFCWPETMYD